MISEYVFSFLIYFIKLSAGNSFEQYILRKTMPVIYRTKKMGKNPAYETKNKRLPVEFMY